MTTPTEGAPYVHIEMGEVLVLEMGKFWAVSGSGVQP